MYAAACAGARPGADPVIRPVMDPVAHAGKNALMEAGIIPLLGLPQPEVKDEAHTLRLAVIGLRARHQATAVDLDEIAGLLRDGASELALERVVSLRAFVASAAAGLAPETL
ncbi:hypothetical protein [Methylobacterium nodulans]|uniref:Uncharacterized protein n=1 Tax=Methylobacterium nodulans (strain LMG 21967 / CNCM I-2342 / ORS 2060) TaxID=460265 RepID=B8IHQ7_METNO|nr:hypothetical protein [Methylobacterium nodulans]ACL61720.1 hypothetical protein Mnod_6978 [Methylobacterium nodulans ORS 2060]